MTAEKNGVISASFFWVGSEAPINGILPTRWKRYHNAFPYEQRIDTVIYWLSLSEEIRPHLITLYFDEPDWTGHKAGPGNDVTLQKVMYPDSLLGILLSKIESLLIDLYPLICHILNIPPVHVDGHLKNVESMLRE